MIFAIFLAVQVVLAAPKAPPPPVELPPTVVLARYAAALARLREPRIVSFDYMLEQTGTRTMEQSHRVFRKGTNERDETLAVNGKRLAPPSVRIFRGRRNRYSVLTLAPRLEKYTFAYVGPKRNGGHIDYVFSLEPKAAARFAITLVTIDGVHFLPSSLAFHTGSHAGTGTFNFGGRASWWVPFGATAHAKIGMDTADERLTFSEYRFPTDLPPSTFSEPRALPTFAPAPF